MKMATGRRRTESFIVNLAGASTIPVTGTLNDSSTGNVNLTNGQLGIIAVSPYGSIAMNAFTDATPTVAEAPIIQIVQGTPYSQSVATSNVAYPLWVRPFEATAPIDGRNQNLLVTKQAYRDGKNNVWVLGEPSATTTGQINVLDETSYALHIAFQGRRIEGQYSLEQAASLTVEIETPNFTALSATYTEPIDWITQKIGYEINRSSQHFQLGARFQGNDPVIALAVSDDDTAGQEIAALTVGASVSVFKYQSVTRSLILTKELLDSIQAAATASGFTHIYEIDLSTAGTASAPLVTGLFVIGLDARTAYSDAIPEIKTSLRLGLRRGFNPSTVTLTNTVSADEGQGYARQLELLYAATAGQRKYAQKHTEDPVVKFDSPIVTGQTYHIYNVLHGVTSQIGHSNTDHVPFREIIAIPRYSTGTTTNPVIATFETAINAYLASSGSNAAIVTL
jgi:hypothetical protein